MGHLQGWWPIKSCQVFKSSRVPTPRSPRGCSILSPLWGHQDPRRASSTFGVGSTGPVRSRQPSSRAKPAAPWRTPDRRGGLGVLRTSNPPLGQPPHAKVPAIDVSWIEGNVFADQGCCCAPDATPSASSTCCVGGDSGLHMSVGSQWETDGGGVRPAVEGTPTAPFEALEPSESRLICFWSGSLGSSVPS